MKKIDWSRIGRLGKRLKEASSVDLDDIERIAIALMASGASRPELVDGIGAALEDAIDWRILVPGLAGELLEVAEDPAIRVLATQIARELRKTWRKLSDDERSAWMTRMLSTVADAA